MTPTVIITGASRGIGKAIATDLAQRGYNLMLVARNEGRLLSVRDECAKIGAKAAVLTIDLTRDDAGAAVRDATLDTFGPAWGLVNNAGMAESAPLAKSDDDFLRQHMELNFYAPMRIMRSVLPRMIETKGGRVINMCSTAALSGYPYISAYAASKHALLGATRALAKEFAQKGVTFNAICPGYVRTEVWEATIKNIVDKTGLDEVQAEDKLKKLSPQYRIFEPAEIAHTVAFLLSEESHGITGQAISIDGGEIEH
ncbi:MAG: SDR family oxidoreductase [Planctomycetes bacterium]|nr:SDR family oxidoreductase [Planctomycetota bacterium]